MRHNARHQRRGRATEDERQRVLRVRCMPLCGSSSDESAVFDVLTKDDAHTIDIG